MVDSFGAVLRQLREDRGWSLTQLADRVFCSKSLISYVENNVRRPTVKLAADLDQALGSIPVLSTLFALEEGDDDVRRRALLNTFTAAAGLGAFGTLTALADSLRLDMMEVADVHEDWDAVLNGYRQRLVLEPSAEFGDELLAKMATARQLIAQTPDKREIMSASAQLAMIYGIWSGYNNALNTGLNYYGTANAFAERSGDTSTQLWVLARTASAGPYQGLSGRATQNYIDKALALAGDKPSTGALEAYAAQVHLAALQGDLAGGRAAVLKMRRIAEKLPAIEGAGPIQRVASFHAYLEGKLGNMTDADRAIRSAAPDLKHLPQWMVEAQIYFALAVARHGHYSQAVDYALKSAQSMRYSVRVLRLAVDDVVSAVPPGYDYEPLDELRRHGTSGPKPWELIRT